MTGYLLANFVFFLPVNVALGRWNLHHNICVHFADLTKIVQSKSQSYKLGITLENLTETDQDYNYNKSSTWAPQSRLFRIVITKGKTQ